MKKLTIKNDSEKPVPTEVLAESIKTIAEGVRKLRRGPLNDKALFLLVQHATPSRGYPYKKPTITEIEAVFEGIDALERTYLKKKVS